MHRRVVIDDGYDYYSPCVHEDCPACGWRAEHGKREPGRSPECATTIDPPTLIPLGRTLVSFDGRNLLFGSDSQSVVRVRMCLQGADVTDALTFMARYYEPDLDRPSIHDIRRLIHQALAALDGDHPDLVRIASVELLAELVAQATSLRKTT